VCPKYCVTIHFKRHEFDIAVVKENASGEGVKDALSENGAVCVRVEGFADANAHCDANRCGDGVEECGSELFPGVEALDLSEANTESDAFEQLVEDDGDEKGLEFVRSDTQCEADDDGVENTVYYAREWGKERSVKRAEWWAHPYLSLSIFIYLEISIFHLMSTYMPISRKMVARSVLISWWSTSIMPLTTSCE